MTESYSFLRLRRLFNIVDKLMSFGAGYVGSNSVSTIYKHWNLGKFS